jgi:hypothetical protein
MRCGYLIVRADKTASAARQALPGPAPHRAFSLSAAWRGALPGALAGPSCAPPPRGAGGPGAGPGPAMLPQPLCAAARALGMGSTGRTRDAAHAARLLPGRRLCSSPKPPCAGLMHSVIASVSINACQVRATPACSLGRPARVRTCAGLPKGTRASAGAGLAARLQLRPMEPRGPCAQARSCNTVWCV